MALNQLKFLLRPGTLLVLSKLSVVISAETLMTPPLLLAERLLNERAEPLLALQNRFRQRALLWMYPKFLKPAAGTGRGFTVSNSRSQ